MLNPEKYQQYQENKKINRIEGDGTKDSPYENHNTVSTLWFLAYMAYELAHEKLKLGIPVYIRIFVQSEGFITFELGLVLEDVKGLPKRVIPRVSLTEYLTIEDVLWPELTIKNRLIRYGQKIKQLLEGHSDKDSIDKARIVVKLTQIVLEALYLRISQDTEFEELV